MFDRNHSLAQVRYLVLYADKISTFDGRWNLQACATHFDIWHKKEQQLNFHAFLEKRFFKKNLLEGKAKPEQVAHL